MIGVHANLLSSEVEGEFTVFHWLQLVVGRKVGESEMKHVSLFQTGRRI